MYELQNWSHYVFAKVLDTLKWPCKSVRHPWRRSNEDPDPRSERNWWVRSPFHGSVEEIRWPNMFLHCRTIRIGIHNRTPVVILKINFDSIRKLTNYYRVENYFPLKKLSSFLELLIKGRGWHLVVAVTSCTGVAHRLAMLTIGCSPWLKF